MAATYIALSQEMVLLLTAGLMLCSLVCVFAALRNGGEVLQNTVLLLLCQAFIMLTALLHLASNPGSIVSRVMGFVTLALGVAPIILKKNSFQGARYCVALGAMMAACTMFLF